MKLIDYLALKGAKAHIWAVAVGLPISGVYSWLKGTVPNIHNIRKIQKATDGAVGPDDWGNQNDK
jgi:predicted transcriptional regulator